jgi:hypothetical protein
MMTEEECNDKYQTFWVFFIPVITEEVLEAQNRFTPLGDTECADGYYAAYSKIVDFLKKNAELFGIDLNNLSESKNDACRNFLLYFTPILKQEALEAKKKSRGLSFTGFGEGYSDAYRRVVDLVQQNAEIFDIDFKELSLDDIDPYRDLL